MQEIIVVPRAGTWIETPASRLLQDQALVVPRAGTWIETTNSDWRILPACMSFPVRERGLKLLKTGPAGPHTPVVPRAGTWIETTHSNSFPYNSTWSFPVRERGLKHSIFD